MCTGFPDIEQLLKLCRASPAHAEQLCQQFRDSVLAGYRDKPHYAELQQYYSQHTDYLKTLSDPALKTEYLHQQLLYKVQQLQQKADEIQQCSDRLKILLQQQR
ncbi:hypothetical protein QE250_13350 [Chromatiaceae bacterium AAb-1]|nr:hypothetical protein [Chromatiaceae bacterium AAb-1]